MWGWGSNYYLQLGKTAPSDADEKGGAPAASPSGTRMFMLRTPKRVLKVRKVVVSYAPIVDETILVIVVIIRETRSSKLLTIT